MDAALYGICRCCLEYGYHRDLMKEYQNNDVQETYIDMFLDCFNLFLSTNFNLSSLICNICIEELRRANKFRKMVVANEQKLLNRVNNETIYINLPRLEMEVDVKKEEVKCEPQSEDEDFNDDYNICDDDFDESTTDDIREVELLSRFPKPPTLPTRDSLYMSDCIGYVRHLDALKGEIISAQMIKTLIEEHERNKSKNSRVTEKMAQIVNTSLILENSNVTPFKSKNKTGFPCFYCRHIFEDLVTLRDHQHKLHPKDEIKKALNTYGAESLVVYVDITDLKCTICHQIIPNLSELKKHLTRDHNKMFYQDFTDRVIPFKLFQQNTDGYKFECQICGFCFETFGSIERHMNVHYRNYICRECGTGFVTKYRLKVHIKSMHIEGKFPCEICKKVFMTQQKLKNHVDTVHRMVKRFRCPHCSERFAEYFRRQKHIVEVHDGPKLHYKCNVCEKSFDRRYTLSRHMKRDHLEERDFECEMCAYKCFTKNELRVHMVKHNGERIFECSVCHKSYARKKTLREHMRIHNNDRRFCCAVCGQAFVQKCSLKGHIKTHHVDYHLPI